MDTTEQAPTPQRHWDEVYATKDVESVSWFQSTPEVSLRLVERVPGSVVDVGAGASTLVDSLLARGPTDITLLDVSAEALEVTRRRLGDRAAQVSFVAVDVLEWEPGRDYDCWHDRAVFHFLTDPEQQRSYVRTASRTIAPGGGLVLGTFALDGPEQCSGLPTARYDADGLAAVFGDGFVLEHAETEVHHTPWGSDQAFTLVVLRRAPA